MEKERREQRERRVVAEEDGVAREQDGEEAAERLRAAGRVEERGGVGGHENS